MASRENSLGSRVSEPTGTHAQWIQLEAKRATCTDRERPGNEDEQRASESEKWLETRTTGCEVTRVNPNIFQPRPQGAFPWPLPTSKGREKRSGDEVACLWPLFFLSFLMPFTPHHVCCEFRGVIDGIVDFHLSSISKFWMISSCLLGWNLT